MSKLKGEVKIELFDKNGKLKQVEIGENIITNAPFDLIKATFSDVNARILAGQSSISPLYATNIVNNFNGILLLDSLLLEDKNNYFEQIFTSNDVGHACASISDNIDSPKVGAYNSTASKITDNSIRYVYEFGEGKAVGTIKSVALCPYKLGRVGLNDDTFFTNTTFNITDNGFYATAYGNIVRISKFKNENSYVVNPIAGDDNNYEFLTVCGYKEGVVYAYKVINENNIYKLTMFKITLSKYYNKSNFSTKFYTYSNINGETRLLADTIEPIAISDNLKFGSDTYQRIFIMSEYDNKIYFLEGYAYKDTINLVTFDKNSETFTIKEVVNPRGTVKFNGFVRNDLGFFLSFGDKIGRFTENFVFMNYIDIPEFMAIDDTLNVEIYPVGDTGLIKLFYYKYPTRKNCITKDFIHYNFKTQGDILFTNRMPHKDFDKSLLLILTNNNGIGSDTIRVQQNLMVLSTIKNLSNPVIKGETDIMKVTYSIIKTE